MTRVSIKPITPYFHRDQLCIFSAIFAKISAFCVLTLIFLSQFIPTAYVEIKAVFLGVGFVALLISIFREKSFLQRWQISAILLLVCCALFFSVYGVILGNPGATRVLSVWVLWPLLFLFFSSLLVLPNAFIWLTRTFIASLGAVVIYGYLYLGKASGITPEILYFELDQGQGIGFYDGFIEFRLYSIQSLIFLVPFYIHFLLERHKISKINILSASTFFLATTLLLSVMTGRKAMLLILLLTPLIIFFSNFYLNNEKKTKIYFLQILRIIVVAGAIAYFSSYIGLRFDAILEMFLGGFDFESGDTSATDRGLQFQALIEGWLNSSILFGAGNGAVASIVRSHDTPWAYELTYVYLLFSTGIIGLVTYFGWYLYSLIRLRAAIRNRPDLVVYAAPMLTGSIAFCVAAATNPYFVKFDYLWIVLLPFLISGWAKYQALVLRK